MTVDRHPVDPMPLSARIQPRLLATIVGLLESDYVNERLRTAQNPQEIIEAIRAAQQVAIG